MGCTYKSPKFTRGGQSVFIATPAYQLVKPGYAYSLAMTTSELTHRGIPFELAIMHDNCHVDDGRNALVKDFLYDSQCTDFVFLDADLRWEVKMFMRLLSHDSENIIAGAYPLKSSPTRFPVGKILDGPEDIDNIKKGLISVSYAPTGFMRIPRTVFEKLKDSQTKRGRVKPTLRYFERRYTDETYDGGDVTFCRKWIGAGGKVLIDGKLVLEHIGEHRWGGCFLNYLAKEENRNVHTINTKDPTPKYKPDTSNKASFADAVQSLEDDKSSIEDFKVIANSWGNKPWAATPEYAELAWKMAMELNPGDTLLECGSGFTSIVLGLAAKKRGFRHIILENNYVWVGTLKKWFEGLGLRSELIHSKYNRIKRWYEYEPDKDTKIKLLIIDGPSRDIGGMRLYPVSQPWSDGAALLVDDTISIEGHGAWKQLKLGGRSAVAGYVKSNNTEFLTIEKENESEPVVQTK
jgi:hypothetical protein